MFSFSIILFQETKKGMYTYWRCAYHKEFSCKARMKTNFKDDLCEIFVGIHTHPIKNKDATKRKVARPMQDLTPRTSFKSEPTSQDDFYSHFLVPEVQLDADLAEYPENNSLNMEEAGIIGDL